MLGIQFTDTGHAEKAKAFDDFGLQQFEHAHDAVTAGGNEAVAVDTANADHVGAKRQRLDDVGASVEAAVDDNLSAAGDG